MKYQSVCHFNNKEHYLDGLYINGSVLQPLTLEIIMSRQAQTIRSMSYPTLANQIFGHTEIGIKFEVQRISQTQFDGMYANFDLDEFCVYRRKKDSILGAGEKVLSIHKLIFESFNDYATGNLLLRYFAARINYVNESLLEISTTDKDSIAFLGMELLKIRNK